MKVTFFRDITFFLVALALYAIFLRDSTIDFLEALALLFLCIVYIFSIFIVNSIHDSKLKQIQNPRLLKEMKSYDSDDDVEIPEDGILIKLTPLGSENPSGEEDNWNNEEDIGLLDLKIEETKIKYN